MAKKATDRDKLAPWQQKLHDVIYEADTPAGKAFDIVLLVAILLSVLVVMLESVPNYNKHFAVEFNLIEWVFTVLFSLEYVARIVCIRRPISYIISFYGIIDILSIIPTYLGLFITGTNSLMVIRSLRLLRVFRILKLGQYLKEARSLMAALRASRQKIVIFLFAVLMLTIILGTIMYLVETPEDGFTSIPRSIYWAIVTLTTVGYGDIAPHSDLGQFIAAIVMILGYAIIAVPTGIVSSEIYKQDSSQVSTQACQNCSREGHDSDAEYCKYCGEPLETPE